MVDPKAFCETWKHNLQSRYQIHIDCEWDEKLEMCFFKIRFPNGDLFALSVMNYSSSEGVRESIQKVDWSFYVPNPSSEWMEFFRFIADSVPRC